MTLDYLLMVAAFILLLLAALSVPLGRVSPGWAGMACWALALLV